MGRSTCIAHRIFVSEFIIVTWFNSTLASLTRDPLYTCLQKPLIVFTSRNTNPAVPAGSVETWVATRLDALEMPKSATFAVRDSSNKTLLGFTSLCITGGSYIQTWTESSKNVHRLP